MAAGARAQQPLTFHPVAPQGFGDRQNSWAWSMEWFQGKLYVGTTRAHDCVVAAAMSTVFPVYPPSDPDTQCTPDPKDLAVQAEIWSWSPGAAGWTRVLQSPNNVAIPGSGKFTARDIGYRGMLAWQEPDGTQALYVGGCSSRVMYPGAPPARLLRSTDGVTFNPVPQAPGTFLGDLRYPCFRGITSFNGKFYALATDHAGKGVVLESADPKLGNNSFRQITPEGAVAYEALAVNGALYITFVHQQGFRLYKTSAAGPLPYAFTPIIVDGGYKAPAGNPIALSMAVFNSMLYIGGNSVRSSNVINCALNILCVQSIVGNGGAEIFRVHPDDTWDLVAGESRSTPAGQKNALSGRGAGLGWVLNQHMWRMEVYEGVLYITMFPLNYEIRWPARMSRRIWVVISGRLVTEYNSTPSIIVDSATSSTMACGV
jgi:hypothetical protein